MVDLLVHAYLLCFPLVHCKNSEHHRHHQQHLNAARFRLNFLWINAFYVHSSTCLNWASSTAVPATDWTGSTIHRGCAKSILREVLFGDRPENIGRSLLFCLNRLWTHCCSVCATIYSIWSAPITHVLDSVVYRNTILM